MVVGESQPPPRQTQDITIITGTHSYHYFSTYYVTGIMPSTLCTISMNTKNLEAGTIITPISQMTKLRLRRC